MKLNIVEDNITKSDIQEIVRIVKLEMEKENTEEVFRKINGSTLSRDGLLFLKIIIQKIKPKNILEFGSGLSSLLISETINSMNDCRFFSVDNVQQFIKSAHSNIKNPVNVTFIHAPIKLSVIEYCPFVTYSKKCLANLQNVDSLDLVLIDGPYGRIFNRDAPLFLISNKIKKNSVIMLDDSNRPKEQEVLKLWKEKYGDTIEIIQIPEFSHGLAIILIKGQLPNISFDYIFRFKKVIESCESLWNNRIYMKKINRLK